MSRWIVRPQRVVILGGLLLYALAREAGAIKIYGCCPKCGKEFELPPRRKDPFRVECPACKKKITRLQAILCYIRKRGEEGVR